MTQQAVAKAAGVSTSTVSRVVNDDPRVAAATADAVRRAMKLVSFVPNIRRQGPRFGEVRSLKSSTVAFLVFGTKGEQAAPAFEQLLRGVSAASAAFELNMIFSYVSDLTHLPPRIVQRRVDGLLLHGERPSPAVQHGLRSMPTVWLMANRQRPAWGDQVMPDNTLIGEIAAQYLLRRGHRRLAYIGTDVGWWAMGIRAMAFSAAARSAGAEVELLQASPEATGDFWDQQDRGAVADALVDRLQASDSMPTGLFIAEDRLAPLIDASLARRGVRLGPGRDAEIISCNNERPYLMGLSDQPATIDIRAESIGRRAVEQLAWRLRHPHLGERVRSMIEPMLIEAL